MVTSQPACTLSIFWSRAECPPFCEPTGDGGQSRGTARGKGHAHTALPLRIPTDATTTSLPFVFMSKIDLFWVFR